MLKKKKNLAFRDISETSATNRGVKIKSKHNKSTIKKETCMGIVESPKACMWSHQNFLSKSVKEQGHMLQYGRHTGIKKQQLYILLNCKLQSLPN